MGGWRGYGWLSWWRALWDDDASRRRRKAAAVPRTRKELLLQRLDDEYGHRVAGSQHVVRTLRRWLDDLHAHLDLSHCERTVVRQLPQDLADDVVAYVRDHSHREQLRITLPPGLSQQYGWWSAYGLG